jgi:hypothetical protein
VRLAIDVHAGITKRRSLVDGVGRPGGEVKVTGR